MRRLSTKARRRVSARGRGMRSGGEARSSEIPVSSDADTRGTGKDAVSVAVCRVRRRRADPVPYGETRKPGGCNKSLRQITSRMFHVKHSGRSPAIVSRETFGAFSFGNSAVCGALFRARRSTRCRAIVRNPVSSRPILSLSPSSPPVISRALLLAPRLRAPPPSAARVLIEDPPPPIRPSFRTPLRQRRSNVVRRLALCLFPRKMASRQQKRPRDARSRSTGHHRGFKQDVFHPYLAHLCYNF